MNYEIKKLIISRFNESKYRFYWISIGLMALGTAGFIVGIKWDINKRANLSYLIENLKFPDKFNNLKEYEDKVVFVSGIPQVFNYAIDDKFGVTGNKSIYLKRVTEMYQAKETNNKNNKLHYVWSEYQIENRINPVLPENFRSKSFKSTNVILNGFKIDSEIIFLNISKDKITLDPSNSIFNKENVEFLKDSTYEWEIGKYYVKAYLKQFANSESLGSLRIKFSSLNLVPENGLSVIGYVRNSNIIPINLAGINFWSIFYVKDQMESPQNMIKDGITNTKKLIEALLIISFLSINLGFYLSSIGIYMNKLQKSKEKSLTNNSSKIKPSYLSFRNFRIFIISFYYGTMFSYLIYNYISTSEKNSLSKISKSSKIFSWKELENIELKEDRVFHFRGLNSEIK